MIDALLASNALWYPLRYPAEYAGGGTINKAIHYHYPTGADMAQILSLNNFRDFGGGSVYDAAFGFLDQNPHNTMHIWTGGNESRDRSETTLALPNYVCDRSRPGQSPRRCRARCSPRSATAPRSSRTASSTTARICTSQPQFGDMFSNLTASYDPIFWPIHVNVDRTWWEWQTQQSDRPADRSRRGALAVELHGARHAGDLALRLRVRALLVFHAGRHGGADRAVRLQADPGRQKVKKFRKAEIRLHWVPQLLRSCFVRAFINQPGADATTPCATIRTMPAIWRSSATASATAGRAIATCRRRARAPSTSARAATTRRAITAST